MIAFTAQQLYELAWSKPMTAIAAEYGVEAIHFARMCDENNIPRPAAGYWQKLQFGKLIEQPTLDRRVATSVQPLHVKKARRPGQLA